MLHFPLGPMQDKSQLRHPSHCTVSTLTLLLTFRAKRMWMWFAVNYLEVEGEMEFLPLQVGGICRWPRRI